MIKALTSFLAALAVLVAIAAAALVVCDVVYFRPHQNEIAEILREATPDERNPPADLAGLMKISLHGNISSYAADLLQTELHLFPGKNLFPRIIWKSLVALHLSGSEKMTVVLSRAYTGEGRFGASVACRTLFGHELSTITLDEAASFAALVDNPGYIGHPAEFGKKKLDLLSAYRPR